MAPHRWHAPQRRCRPRSPTRSSARASSLRHLFHVRARPPTAFSPPADVDGVCDTQSAIVAPRHTALTSLLNPSPEPPDVRGLAPRPAHGARRDAATCDALLRAHECEKLVIGAGRLPNFRNAKEYRKPQRLRVLTVVFPVCCCASAYCPQGRHGDLTVNFLEQAVEVCSPPVVGRRSTVIRRPHRPRACGSS